MKPLMRHRLEKYPDDVLAHVRLGALMLARQSPAEAVPMAQAAVRIAPDNAEARNLLGAALNAAGRTNEAIEQFQIALRLRPDFVNARFNLGSALVKAGRLDEAVENFRDTTANGRKLRRDGIQHGRMRGACRSSEVQPSRPYRTDLEVRHPGIQLCSAPARIRSRCASTPCSSDSWAGALALTNPYPFMVVSAAVQNVGHSFPDDAVESSQGVSRRWAFICPLSNRHCRIASTAFA